MSSQLSSLLPLPDRLPDSAPTLQTLELSRALGRLSRRTRQIFLLSRLDGLAYADIARFMEVDIAKVERAMVRALKEAHRGTVSHDEFIQVQASHWYVHLQSPSATASERIEFRHWLDADDRHLAAFQNSERVWRELKAPASLLGASGWHRRKRRIYLVWCLITAFICSLMVTAEAFS
ncbi:RNA polymerase subunit sigma-70 [Pseudomonas floridensis]|uniref:RNA polymerase subunit sigma-70 n=1 Tax=Pseudomonas floridensis TaxID=1958950 RepID=A0A1X0NDF3_9PSED|nr:sigma-70 region 4 domain-containing protein [Pseudomonas floridensis]ORC62330.1 RNA polymerase subunit sigma-70 [Pseudomonas floridensis]